MYSGRVQWVDKWHADYYFLSNMIDIVEENSSFIMRIWRLHLVFGYFKSVRIFGKGPS
jgi:hypothetical protein